MNRPAEVLRPGLREETYTVPHFRCLPEDERAAADIIADHIDHLFRRLFVTDDSLVTPACFRYLLCEPHPFGNMALFSKNATPEDVTRDAMPLVECRYPSAALFLDEGSPDQLAAANELGFAPAEAMPLMAVTRDTLEPTSLPDGYSFREVEVDEAEAWSQAVSDGYGLPLRVGSLFGIDRAEARCPGATKYYAIDHDGQMVATSLVYLHNGLAGIYGVSTLAEHRRRGLAAHLTAEPLRLAWELGYSTGLLQASEMGAPVYSRIGFRTYGHMALLVRMPDVA